MYNKVKCKPSAQYFKLVWRLYLYMKVVSPKFILVMYMKLGQGGRKKSPQSLEKINFSAWVEMIK